MELGPLPPLALGPIGLEEDNWGLEGAWMALTQPDEGASGGSVGLWAVDRLPHEASTEGECLSRNGPAAVLRC